jgi:ubiquitin-like domain-containing CTD phosphatase 1
MHLHQPHRLVIRPYKKAHLTRNSDVELLHLMHYLTLVGQLDKLSHLDHRRWERYLAKHGARALQG